MHSFPHVRFYSEFLPTPVASLTTLNLKTKWIMTADADTDADANITISWTADNVDAALEVITDLDVVCNVAWDFFLDQEKLNTYNPIESSTEMMIWLAKVGTAEPLDDHPNVTTLEVSGIDL